MTQEKLSYDKAADILIALIQSSGYPSRLKDLLETSATLRSDANALTQGRIYRKVSRSLPVALQIDALLFREFLDTLVQGDPHQDVYDLQKELDRALDLDGD